MTKKPNELRLIQVLQGNYCIEWDWSINFNYKFLTNFNTIVRFKKKCLKPNKFKAKKNMRKVHLSMINIVSFTKFWFGLLTLINTSGSNQWWKPSLSHRYQYTLGLNTGKENTKKNKLVKEKNKVIYKNYF